MLTVRQRYVPVFAPHRTQQTARVARVGGVLGIDTLAQKLTFAAVLTLPPATVGWLVFGPTGAVVGFAIGALASLPLFLEG